MNAKATQKQWTEAIEPKVGRRTAVVASICQCSDSLKGWWIRFDPIQCLRKDEALDMFNVNHDTRIGVVQMGDEFGKALPWRDYHFRFDELFKTGEDGRTPEEDWFEALQVAAAVVRFNEAVEIRKSIGEPELDEQDKRRL
jgi:hypothetical protein